MDGLGAAAAGLRRVGRDGHLRLAFERRGPRTVLARSAWSLPLQVLAPVELGDPAAVVSILNPTGGLVGGDRLTIDVAVGPAAHACLTTPSATKVYRTAGEVARQHVTIRAETGAVVEWVPDHTIPFAGCAFEQRIDVEVADGARLLLVDAFSAGRVARGERWAFARLDSAIRIRDAKGLLLTDRLVLQPGRGLDVDGLGVTEGASYVATVVVVDPAAIEPLAAALSASVPGVVLGVARLARRGLVVRCLAAQAPALGEALEQIWARVREIGPGLPPLALRKP